MIKCPSSKLFFIVLSLISFLHHSIWSFLPQDMVIFLWLARLVQTQNSGHFLGSGSFGVLTAAHFLDGLWSEFGFVFFIKVVVLCLTFYRYKIQVIWTFLCQVMAKWTNNDHLVISVQWQCTLPRFDPIVHYVNVIFWAWFLHENCVIMCLLSYPIVLIPIGWAKL